MCQPLAQLADHRCLALPFHGASPFAKTLAHRLSQLGGKLFSEDAMGGWKKRGGRKTSRMTPLPKRGFGPPSYGTFSTPLACRCFVFPVQKSTTEQTRSSFGGVQNFSGGRVLWYVFLPPYVLHPPISWPNFLLAVGAFLLTVELLCLQSVEVPLRLVKWACS